MLADAHALYRGISTFDSGLTGGTSDSDGGMYGAEAQYTQMLLGGKGGGQVDVPGSGEWASVAPGCCGGHCAFS